MSNIRILKISLLVMLVLASMGAVASAASDYRNIIVNAADRLVVLQNNSGSWDWIVTNQTGHTAIYYYNIAGVTAEGLIDAYKLTNDVMYLNAAKKAGDYINDTAINYTQRQNAFNIIFLYNLAQVSGESRYSTKATAIFTHITTEQNYWSLNNGNYCTDTGCSATQLVAAYKNYRGAETVSHGVVAWDLMSFVEAAQLAGNNTFAIEMAGEINTYLTQPGYNEGVQYYELGLSSGIKALSLVGMDYSSLKNRLLLRQSATGEFINTGPDGQETVQGTAYAVMALKAVNDSSASLAVSYLLKNFGYNNISGWLEAGVEYSEVTSEGLQALFDYINIYQTASIVSANPSTVNNSFTPSISAVLARGDTVYLGRSVSYIGPAIGVDGDTIKWNVTVSGPVGLTPDMVDLDEVGFNDPPGGVTLGTYHYPFAVVGSNLIANGSCDAADEHNNSCVAVAGFSLDDNDIFTDADRIKFSLNAPNGAYTITYKLVNTTDGMVLGMHEVVVNVLNMIVVPLPIDPSGNTTATINVTSPSGNVVVTVPENTTATVNGNPLVNISVNSTTALPPAASVALSANDRVVGEIVSLGPEGATFNPPIQVRFNYTEPLPSGVSEDSLEARFFNASSNAWEILTIAERNTSLNYIIANVTHFSTFTLLGTISTAPEAPSTDAGGGTGGGGVVSSEPYANIVKSETREGNLIANTPVTYAFKTAELSIYEIAVTGKENENDIALKVEVLKGTSTLIKEPASGIVYKNVNVWSGTKRIKEVLIRFKAENSWLSSNSLAGSDVRMVKWDGSKWVQLETAEKRRDDAYTYYEAKTDSLSSFAIVGLRGMAEAAATPTIARPVIPTPAETAKTAAPTPGQTEKTPGFGIALAIAVLSAVCLFRRGRCQ